MRHIYIFEVIKQFFSLISPRAVSCVSKFYRLRRMISSLESNKLKPDCPSNFQKKSVIFLMNPWSGANVPFYQFYLAKLSNMNSAKAFLLHDNFSLFPNVYSFYYRLFFVNGYEKKQTESVALNFSEKRQILSIVKANIIWQSRSEFFVELVPRVFLRWLFKRQQFHFINVRKKLVTDFESIEKLIIPGGVYSVSASYVLAAKQLGILYYTYDSGADGEVIFCRNGIASHLDDIEDFNYFELSDDQVEHLQIQGDELLNKRAMGIDKFKYQKVPLKSGGSDEFQETLPNQMRILVPLSCPWDAASLCRQDLFQSEISFLKHVLKCFSNDLVIVRMHPVERYAYGRRNDRISEFLKPYTNCHFVPADADVNTYALLQGVDLVICRNTTIGLEAHILDIPVISTTKSYWNKNCSWDRATIDKNQAKLLYAVAQGHSWLFPSCNLQNVYGFFDQQSEFPKFPEFIALMDYNSTVTKQRLVV